MFAFPLATAFAAETAAVLEMHAEGEVQIAPDGHVSDYRLTSTLAPLLAQLVDRNVRSWEFQPVLVDGKPVVAKTHVALHLRAEPNGQSQDQYRIRILNVEFGGLQHADLRPPTYPDAAVRAGLGAKVLLAITIDEQGRVSDAQAYQTSLDARGSSEEQAESWRRVFEQSSVAGAKHWHFDLTETFNGKPIGAHVMVPVVYALRGIGGQREVRDGRWKAYVPGPVHPAPWMNPTGANADFSELKNGEAKSLDSPFHLKGDVIGSLL